MREIAPTCADLKSSQLGMMDNSQNSFKETFNVFRLLKVLRQFKKVHYKTLICRSLLLNKHTFVTVEENIRQKQLF